ncbi:phage tail protein [Alkaliphilus sp. B6464]|uniref:phage tail protein n=1 Tax=Alkaliphilus sp. B6464 TaxID=2731219 RepID=UPI001BA89014|nr:hypothetical protein [Alkaliphilus sp. B6464]QUH21074.1 hypothetical protein HYG84_15100 [Alkaliphilus sp. B6464]
MSNSNFIVRGGADFSSIRNEMQRTQNMMNGFQTSINQSMSGISKAFKIALGYVSVRAIAGFVKETTKLGSDVAEIQNVVNVTFGSMTKDIEEFSKSAMDNFGLSELAAKKYSSTMGAMLKSSGIAGEAVRDMSIDLTKLTADMASFHNMSNDEVFTKIMSGMSGMSMPLKELGINMNVANLEAFAMSQGMDKAYRKMSQAEQAMVRYNYLLSVTGDMQGDFSRNAHNWGHQLKILSEQWNTLKATIGQGFINILAPIVTGLNILIKKIQVAAEYFRAFTALIFGDTQASKGTAKNLGYTVDSLEDAEDGFGDVGKAGKKAGKDLKGATTGFDEINKLTDKAGSSAGDLADDLGGIGSIDLGTASSGELDLDTSKIESQLGKVKRLFEDFYNDWGAKDFFKGFRDGLDLINFDSIKTNFKTVFSGLGEIANTAIMAMQPIFQAAGQAFGTSIKYGIAIAGNLFEPITLGWANFITNMKGPIQDWINETSNTITNGFNNLTGIYENLGQSWLNSVNKYKEPIAKAVEDTLTNSSNTFMLIGTVVADTFEIVTDKVKEFAEENKGEIQNFTDSIFGIFTDAWDLINDVWEDTLNSLKVFWDTWGKDIVAGAMNIVNDIGGWFLYLWNDLVKPTWDTMMSWLKKIWDENLKGLVDELLGFVGRVGDLILKLWEGVFKPLVDDILNVLVPAFKNAFNLILDIVGTVVNGIIGIIKNLLKILNGIIDFVVGVFTGDWQRAWEGVKGIFSGVIGSLEEIFKGVINGITGIANSFIRFWNRIELEVPEVDIPLFGKAGGFRIGVPTIPEIPKLATGGITDVNNPFMAIVGDNRTQREVVAPLDDLMGMITSAVSGAAGNNQGSGDIQVIVKVGEDTLTEKVVSNINRQNRISGKTVITV